MAFEYSIIETTTYTVIRESVDGEEGFELKTFDTYDEADEFATILNKEMAASAVAAYPDDAEDQDDHTISAADPAYIPSGAYQLSSPAASMIPEKWLRKNHPPETDNQES
jgi:hypothetical protein